ncbi:MAG TPA: sugar transferase [Bacteroidales bacterium]|nr:sugar transferase [Bacteroidales bacterium]
MSRKLQLLKYLLADFISAITSWCAFFAYRKYVSDLTPAGINTLADPDRQFHTGLFIVPFFWLFLYYISGYYSDVFRKSRLSEIWITFGNTFIGTIFLFLVFNPVGANYINPSHAYSLYLYLFIFHFILTYFPRIIITTVTTHRVHRGELGFNTLMIGSNEKAVDTFLEMRSQKSGSGNKFIGFVHVHENMKNMLNSYLPHLGSLENIRGIISDKKVEEVIIAIESSEHDMINRIINKLIDADVVVKAIPSMYDILTGRVRMNSILGTPLISVSHNLMPAWQENVKSFLDYVISALALLISLPAIIFIIIGIKLTSKGPVFYSHERIGRYGKPFIIYKFRSMYYQAEKNGPELSSKKDERITPFGRFMRKARLDEIPNFLNVIMGDMSLVGPRPERKYYIDQIVKQAPHYLHLLKVKPGITSWGQVKYGYAENVDQMIQRLKYDLIYLDNMSLFVDFKIIIYTILTIIKRKGI